MTCPLCRGDTIVARTTENTEKYIKRKRKCVVCGNLFFTVEKFDKFTKHKGFDMQKSWYQAQADLDAIGGKLDELDFGGEENGKF